MLVKGAGGELEAGQGQGSLEKLVSHLMYTLEMNCDSTSLGRERELRFLNCAILHKEEEPAPESVQDKEQGLEESGNSSKITQIWCQCCSWTLVTLL